MVLKVKPPVENDNIRSNRYYKLLPHQHLDKKYTISDMTKLVDHHMKIAKMACFDHNQNKEDNRDCIYKEYEAILENGLKNGIYMDNPEVMEKQINRFKAENYPKNNGLITAPILIRKHYDAEIIQLMEAWWHIVLNESKRDQLSFNYVAWKLNFTNISIINGDVRTGNPWFYTISHRKNYGFKMFKIKIKKALGINE